jgi:hypothetical protein
VEILEDAPELSGASFYLQLLAGTVLSKYRKQTGEG